MSWYWTWYYQNYHLKPCCISLSSIVLQHLYFKYILLIIVSTFLTAGLLLVVFSVWYLHFYFSKVSECFFHLWFISAQSDKELQTKILCFCNPEVEPEKLQSDPSSHAASVRHLCPVPACSPCVCCQVEKCLNLVLLGWEMFPVDDRCSLQPLRGTTQQITQYLFSSSA